MLREGQGYRFNTFDSKLPTSQQDQRQKCSLLNKNWKQKSASPSLSKARKKLLLTICSDFSALSLISLILPKSCWIAFWASSRAWKRNNVRVERKAAFSFHLLRNTQLLPTAPGLGQRRGAVFLQRKCHQHIKSQCSSLILNKKYTTLHIEHWVLA